MRNVTNNNLEMANPEVATEAVPRKRRISKKRLARYTFLTILALTAGYIHYKYVSTLFENDRNFSYLSEMEREMSFRTELGFYYSYYKTIVQERPFMAGITKLMYDRLVEFPKEVNAFNRFNIHPEVLIGAIYRYFEPALNTTRHCHIVDRGEGLTQVESCNGIGQPILFYLEAVWVLAGVMVAGIFFHAVALSETVLGGLLAVLQYFANHAECTRIQWAPNERENMAAPFLMLQTWLVSLQLRGKGPSYQSQISIFILNCICLLFWQFTQFIFLTQIAIFFIMEQLKIIDLKTLCILLHSHFCGLHMAVLLLQGNDMLKSSLYASFFLVLSAYCLFFSSLRVKVENRLDLFIESWLVILRIGITVCASFYLKKLISDFLGVEEDSHIWDILYSKFTDYNNFHTLLYTCSEVFDFLPLKSVQKLFFSFLIPYALISLVNIATHWFSNALYGYKKDQTELENNKNNAIDKNNQSDGEDSGIENTETIRKRKKNDLNFINKGIKSKTERTKTKDKLVCFLRNLNMEPAIFYNISQMVVYGVMAVLVMRLKLLFVPQLIVVSSLVLNKKYYRLPRKYMKYVPIFWVASLIPVLVNLINNVNEEISHIGEFSDIHQEELLEWISKSASGAFAGSMPLMATVLLVTRRPVVVHPHYEHYDVRQRAYTVYKVYGKFTPEEYYEELNKLKVSYLIVETKYCYGKSSKGCSLDQIWSIEQPLTPPERVPLCRSLLRGRIDHFYPVYKNSHYAVFKLHDYSVKYMPRSFDT